VLAPLPSPHTAMAAASTPANLAAPGVSAVAAKVQSLPDVLRSKHPATWSTGDVSVWVTGWGTSFTPAAEQVMQNGVDGGTLHDLLNDVSPSSKDARSSLHGDSLSLSLSLSVFVRVSVRVINSKLQNSKCLTHLQTCAESMGISTGGGQSRHGPMSPRE
jgi:hypothetical protein